MPARESAVRSYYDYVDDGAYERFDDLFAADVVYVRPGQGPIEGIEAFRAFYEEERPLSSGEHEVETLVAEGDAVAVRGRFVGEQDGERVAFGFADFHEFDDAGKITRRYSYTDRDEV